MTVTIAKFGNVEQAKDWKKELTTANQEIEGYMEMTPQQLKDSKDTTGGIGEWKKNQYYLDHNIQPADYNAFGFVKSSLSILTIAFFTVVVYASSMIAKEYNWGTYKFLMIRPASRLEILSSKFIALMIFAISLYLFHFVVTYICGGIVYGFHVDSLQTIEWINGSIQESTVLQDIFRSYGYQFIESTLYISIAFMLATLLRSNGFAIAATFLLSTIGSIVSVAFSKYTFAKYILFANLDLSMYDTGDVLIKGMTKGFSITMLLIYFAIFMFTSFFVFKKRDLT